MKYIQRHLLLAAALLAASFLFAPLVGCGRSKPAADPIVGTWRSPSRSTVAPQSLIIAKVGGGYLAIVSRGPGFQGRAPLIRAGDTLSGTLTFPPVAGGSGLSVPVEIQYQPASGHLTWSQAFRRTYSSAIWDGMTKPVEMTEVSDSTALPTPSP